MNVKSLDPLSEPRRLRVVRNLSDLLGCDLDDETLKILIELIELGVDPQSLARIVLDLKDQRYRVDNAARHSLRDKKRDWSRSTALRDSS